MGNVVLDQQQQATLTTVLVTVETAIFYGQAFDESSNAPITEFFTNLKVSISGEEGKKKNVFLNSTLKYAFAEQDRGRTDKLAKVHDPRRPQQGESGCQ